MAMRRFPSSCIPSHSFPTIPDGVEFEGRPAHEGLPESQQMLLISQGRQPTTASLTTPAAAPSQGELAVQPLLEVVRPDASDTRAAAQRRAPRGWYAPVPLQQCPARSPWAHRAQARPTESRRVRLGFEDGALTLRLTTTITTLRRPRPLRQVAVTMTAARAEAVDPTRRLLAWRRDAQLDLAF
ncbi:hypothetical protein EDB89DRAFT_2230673 [Lactarius sanguifluus]|nr:hypothetical protein EDB89DRAFT_2230673 [Lactarius sanguifluus]